MASAVGSIQEAWGRVFGGADSGSLEEETDKNIKDLFDACFSATHVSAAREGNGEIFVTKGELTAVFSKIFVDNEMERDAVVSYLFGNTEDPSTPVADTDTMNKVIFTASMKKLVAKMSGAGKEAKTERIPAHVEAAQQSDGGLGVHHIAMGLLLVGVAFLTLRTIRA